MLRQNDADLVTYALQSVIQSGTGTAANIGRPAAGKTGTAQNYWDAWFCGYVPQLVTCVWVGYPQGEIPLENVEGLLGGVRRHDPALIWHDFMSQATANMRIKDFAQPSFEGYSLGAPPRRRRRRRRSPRRPLPSRVRRRRGRPSRARRRRPSPRADPLAQPQPRRALRPHQPSPTPSPPAAPRTPRALDSG